jgi:hypothetical protein
MEDDKFTFEMSQEEEREQEDNVEGHLHCEEIPHFLDLMSSLLPADTHAIKKKKLCGLSP